MSASRRYEILLPLLILMSTQPGAQAVRPMPWGFAEIVELILDKPGVIG